MTTFEALPKPNRPEEIVRKLLKLISEKKLRPGAKLPPERELAALLHVSRPSLREALRALSIMKVVEIRQGAGTYITRLEPELLVEHLDFVFALSDTSYLDLLESRKIVEVGLCGLAAQRITAEELARLDACLKRSSASIGDSTLFFRADLDLHECIAEAAGNITLGHFMAGIRRLGQASRQRTTDLPGIKEQVVADHRAIVGALHAHDAEAAQQAMLQHLNNVERRLRESIEEEHATTLDAETQ
ncbi:MAG: FadR family transcriptional regulator [Chloroflexota bacterium]|nr:FadR family transcriptional regulator [Chloroflexota bacterium]